MDIINLKTDVLNMLDDALVHAESPTASAFDLGKVTALRDVLTRINHYEAGLVTRIQAVNLHEGTD